MTVPEKLTDFGIRWGRNSGAHENMSHVHQDPNVATSSTHTEQNTHSGSNAMPLDRILTTNKDPWAHPRSKLAY